VESDEPHYLCFWVKGREGIGGWEWDYQLRAVAETATEVTICYRWSWVFSLLGAGTMRHQAANELVETAMALDALGWRESVGQDLKLAGQRSQSSEAICEPLRQSTRVVQREEQSD
jgi:hypothetical protein